MRKLKKPQAYTVPRYIKRALAALQPPEDLKVSEWAAKYRRLDSKTSAMPGPWLNSRTPYLVGIMDAFNNPEIEEIDFCKPTQVGGTETANNVIGYIIQQDPAPTMVVYPTDKLGESISENRLVPMFRSSPTLRRLWNPTRSQKLELQFRDMYLTIAGSNSPSSLASKAIKYLLMDEVDKYPFKASTKEADPISLARERTKTFADRKIFLTSTPTLKTGHIWRALERCDIVNHYFVPCPYCGEMIELQFKQLKWPEAAEGMTNQDRADQAIYVCQECGAVITDRHKDAMLRAGEWRAVEKRTQVTRRVGFWLNTLYSPFVRFSEIVLEWLNSQGDTERLQNFVNSWLAEPWEDEQVTTSADIVLEHCTELPEFVVPSWAKMLTAGVDVQQTSLYWTIRAWGDHITSQNIAHGQVESWADIERIMNLQYAREDGVPITVALCFVDAGYNADDTYDFCVNNFDWAMPVKGSSNNNASSDYRLTPINRVNARGAALNLVLINTDKYKSMIAARMKKDTGDRGVWLVHADCDRDYAEQVTAEHRVMVRSGSRMVPKWEPKSSHADNHYLDCEVYALAAADMMGVRSMHLMQPALHAESPRANVPEAEEPAWGVQLSQANWGAFS